MRYVDGYVLAIPKKNIKAYKKMAVTGGKIWKKHGALVYVESVADDLDSVKKWGGFPFAAAMKLKKGETVIFAYIVFKSRKHRDLVNAKVHRDPFMSQPKYKDLPMPFEMKRMAYGGFEMIVDA